MLASRWFENVQRTTDKESVATGTGKCTLGKVEYGLPRLVANINTKSEWEVGYSYLALEALNLVGPLGQRVAQCGYLQNWLSHPGRLC